jgi:pectate lyase
MKKILLSTLMLSALVGCKQDDSKKQLLFGKWQGTAWTVAGKDSGRDAKSVGFEFKNDDTYSASFGGQGEKGVFRLDGDKLYTTSEAVNKIEKMVKLSTITADTVVMDMNRVGDSEQLILVKK